MLSLQAARIFGAFIFIIGILFLILVFFEARTDLSHPMQGSVSVMGMMLAQRFGSLFIMGFVASSLAGRGCQMFSAAHPFLESRENASEP